MKLIYKFFKVSFIILLLVSPVQAALLTSSVSPTKIFKCQPATISATFDDAGIVSVNAVVSSQVAVVPDWSHNSNVATTESTTVALTYNGSYWTGTFGNDKNLLWGNRVIRYDVNTGSVVSYSSSSTVFVYSDVCTGTGITNYTQIPSGLGRYTRMLYNGQFTFFGTTVQNGFIGWAIYPFIEIFGTLFYLLVIFVICSTIYLKTQNITQPLAIGIFLLLIFAGTTAIPEIYRQWVIFFLALATTAVYYRVFVRD